MVIFFFFIATCEVVTNMLEHSNQIIRYHRMWLSWLDIAAGLICDWTCLQNLFHYHSDALSMLHLNIVIIFTLDIKVHMDCRIIMWHLYHFKLFCSQSKSDDIIYDFFLIKIWWFFLNYLWYHRIIIILEITY